jgi:hypothetical protein
MTLPKAVAQPPDPILEYFVNRDAERGFFQEMASGARYHRIFCVRADDKGGKSWLLKRLRLESKQAGWPAAYIDLASADAENAEELLLSMARQLGGGVQQALEQVPIPGQGVSIQSGGAVSVQGDVVGGHKVTVNTYGDEKHVAVEVIDRHGYQLRVSALTRAFKTALSALPAASCPMLFLDQFESVNTDYVLPWLRSELFEPLRAGEISSPLIVIASKENIALFRDSEWENAVYCQDLPGLAEAAIRQYWLEKRRLPETFLPTVLILMAGANGLPGKLSEITWLFEQGQKSSGGGGGD